MPEDQMITEVVSADLQKLYNLLEPVKDETPELHTAYTKLKYGITIKYHIEWNLKGYVDIRDRQGIVILQGNTYDIETWWDEEEERRTIARTALLDYYSEEETPYKGR